MYTIEVFVHETKEKFYHTANSKRLLRKYARIVYGIGWTQGNEWFGNSHRIKFVRMPEQVITAAKIDTIYRDTVFKEQL